MSFAIQGLAAAGGIAMGRATVLSSTRLEVQRYFIDPEQIKGELQRLRRARDEVVSELERLLGELSIEAAPELTALLDVHLMLLQDEMLVQGVRYWIEQRHYNAQWALVAQLEQLGRQFDEMEDEYLRQRKADLEQVVERVLRHLQNCKNVQGSAAQGAQGTVSEPRILVAQDLSPADMLALKNSAFAGFVTSSGASTSHTTILARSMGIAAVIGARGAHQRIHQDDWLVVDGQKRLVHVNPDSEMRSAYSQRQLRALQERSALLQIRDMPTRTLDGVEIELLANIELPQDAKGAIEAGAQGVGLFRSEFLFIGRAASDLPDEQEQYLAYRAAVQGAQGRPVTIRTIDIGADKPLNKDKSELQCANPALGLRAVRWSLADLPMFRTQLRAVLRAAAHGKVRLMFPMISHPREIAQVLEQVALAREEVLAQGHDCGQVELGAMIEVPAAALMVERFLRDFDFVSIGTNDLIQYTLAIDRTDEAVAHLYDDLHPAVLGLIARVISAANALNKHVCVCGEMAGEPRLTRLLLGLGLRSFSMHPVRLLAVKREILNSSAEPLGVLAQQVLASDEPHLVLSAAAEADAGQVRGEQTGQLEHPDALPA